MAWTALTYAFGSVLTSSKMTQNQDNFTAMGDGDAGAPKVKPLAINPGTNLYVLRTNASGVVEWQLPKTSLVRADVTALSGSVNPTASFTNVAAINLGDVVTGDLIMISAFFEITGHSSGVEAQVAKTAGTATVVAQSSASTLRGPWTVGSSLKDFLVAGMMRVTGSGTLTLNLQARSIGNDGTIATNFGQIHGVVLIGG